MVEGLGAGTGDVGLIDVTILLGLSSYGIEEDRQIQRQTCTLVFPHSVFPRQRNASC